MGYIYLASPYTHQKKAIEKERYEITMEVTALLIQRGWLVLSPVVHCHELANRYQLPTTASFWKEYDSALLEGASALWVLTLPGWESSVGVRGEIQLASHLSKPLSQVSWPILKIEPCSATDLLDPPIGD